MIMVKTALLVGITTMLLMVSGCSGSRTDQGAGDVQHNDKADYGKAPGSINVRPASLGGICLGDSSQEVVNILGKDYKESSETDEAGYWGEDLNVWSFNGDIVVRLGKESGKVISVVSHSSNFQTNLGIKVGDNEETLFKQYRPKFKEVKSRHSDETLAGWFDIGEEKIMIFDFDRNDGTRVNSNEQMNSGIQEIVLAYWKHYD